jgi:hypothetical protein
MDNLFCQRERVEQRETRARVALSEWSGLPGHDIDGKPEGYGSSATISMCRSHLKGGAYGGPPFAPSPGQARALYRST